MSAVKVKANVTNGTTNGTFADELYSQFLVCPLCSQMFSQPKILSCQHTFCANCIELHYEMDENDRPYRFLLYNHGLSCPVCRQKTSLPTGGVRRLPDNFLVASLTDVISRRKPMMSLISSSSSSACEICSRADSGVDIDAKKASVKCLDCVKVLCAECAELHRRTKVTAQHALFGVSAEQDIECKTHKNETLRLVARR